MTSADLAARPARRLVAAAALLLALPTARAGAQPTQFTIQQIPTFGGTSSFGLDLNGTGHVTGNAQTAVDTPAPRLNAFRWDGTALTNLGTAPGSNNFSRGYAVNDAGVVVGESDNSTSRAFRWENGTMTVLPSLGGGTGAAHDINNAGQIVGISSNGTVARPVIWENGAARDLGAADGSVDSFGRAWAVSQNGDVAGFSRSSAGVSQATLWASGGATQSLGSLGSGRLFSEALGVNDLRQVVGRSSTGLATPGGTSIFEAFLWQEGAMTGLGSLGRTFSQANDINGAGWIVGNATNVSGSPQTATLWWSGAGYELNTLLVGGQGWVLRSAEGINEHGQIAGYGTFEGQTRAFLLTPVATVAPEPATVGLTATGLLALAGVARRRRRSS